MLTKEQSYYFPSANRRGGVSRLPPWLKMKESITAKLKIAGEDGDFDCFVSGFVPGSGDNTGIIGALEFSVYTPEGDIHCIGKSSNFTKEERTSWTITDPVTGEISMKPEMYGRIAVIKGQALSAVALRFTHCTFERWRTDKNQWDCVCDLVQLQEILL